MKRGISFIVADSTYAPSSTQSILFKTRNFSSVYSANAALQLLHLNVYHRKLLRIYVNGKFLALVADLRYG